MFRITRGKGFLLKLENGWTVSVQFGPINYCEHLNRDAPMTIGIDVEDNWSSVDAEVMAWSANETIDPIGYLTVEQVLDFINDVRRLGALAGKGWKTA